MTKSKKLKKERLMMVLATFSLLLADQITKILAINLLDEPVKLIGNFLTLEKTFNPGIAFGIGVHPRLILIFSILLIVLVLKVAKEEMNFENVFSKWAISLILAGAFGNVIDRINKGEVLDFISFNFWPAFNLADIFIVAGVILVIVKYKSILKNSPKRSS
ncbi:signal peptidase II [Candidatus Peregrinibacteria bacterium]|jgi:signal peptidase II|nr:signal peptidase II [Candidatus Peregrinibacteria bacterium]MBT4148644.1 signal peptidase II [Candidatus Peregrinibacteria bacterium]MBT4366221.1 signal peptidase II [Candidatus Peregrinibacteria bacterium]MBT4456025.1 signal peptidase II [Candidatus Peregrinibacteria bacterium]